MKGELGGRCACGARRAGQVALTMRAAGCRGLRKVCGRALAKMRGLEEKEAGGRGVLCAAGHMGGRAWPGEAAREVATRGTLNRIPSLRTRRSAEAAFRAGASSARGGPCGARGASAVRGGSARGGTPGAGAFGERANEPGGEA